MNTAVFVETIELLQKVDIQIAYRKYTKQLFKGKLGYAQKLKLINRRDLRITSVLRFAVKSDNTLYVLINGTNDNYCPFPL